MPFASQTFNTSANAEQLWVVLLDMISNPARYEPDMTLKRLERDSEPIIRWVERHGERSEEHLEIHRDALMVELTVPSPGNNPHLSIIHQIVPSGDTTLLNLAATWGKDAESLTENAPDDKSFAAATIEKRIQELGNRMTRFAEELAK